MKPFRYEGVHTKEISFPLGGIGTGSIGLAGNGRFIDWEIFNRPSKGSVNGCSHFSVKAEADGKLLDARALLGDLQPPYMGDTSTYQHSGFGFGPEQATMAGAPHFRELTFVGEFPFATLQFADEHFPGKVEMTTYNPFIPLNDRDSSIPGAYFDVAFRNTTDRTISYTINLTVANPQRDDLRYNRYSRKGNMHLIKMSSTGLAEDDPKFGDMTIATDAADVSYQEYWYRGGWNDHLEVYWNDFAAPGRYRNRTYSEERPGNRHPDHASLAARLEVAPGETKQARFVMTWSFPNCVNYWNPEKCGCDDGACKPGEAGAAGTASAPTPTDTGKPNIWRNYYASLFADSTESAVYSLNHWDRMFEATKQFKEALFASTLPTTAIDAIAANISILKTATCLRLPNGSFYGFEGCMPNSGCCEGSCTHVWNYAYALPFLFPKLERSMRDLDYTHNMREDGRMSFRTMLPIGRAAMDFHACADGQFGGVMKTYRDWKISGDTEWLKSVWPHVKRSIEYAWADTNEDKWDLDRDGVLEGRQHHTLDMELYGPNAWLNGFYLGALKAGAEMADHLGDMESADAYRELFAKGKQWTEENLFNGEYYVQKVDIKDKSLLEKYDESALRHYWNDEAQEIKYQIADGCGIDQVVVQWHANLSGLGDIFDKERTRQALASIYKYNFKRNMRDEFNAWRLYSLNDEAGLKMCTWPEGTKRPIVPLTYAQETMNGFEYQAAVHMIQEGMVAEGMEAVAAVRERYDGVKRNPWNEIECGSNYARSMASYSLLLAFSGFRYDAVNGMIGFDPIFGYGEQAGSADGEDVAESTPIKGGEAVKFRSFWSLDAAWGTFEVQEKRVALRVLYGALDVKELQLPFLAGRDIQAVERGDNAVAFTSEGGIVRFAEAIAVQAGEVLAVQS